MIRQTVRPVALAALGLLVASSAWGQVFLRQTSSAAQLLALEHFGEARIVKVGDFDLDGDTTNQDELPVYVALDVEAGTVTAGNTADITFRLHGATFDEQATSNHLQQHSSAGCTGTAGGVLESVVGDGGGRGESHVTYRVEVTDTGAAGLAATQYICFLVPDLNVALANVSTNPESYIPGVSVRTEIVTVATTGVTFPSGTTAIRGAADEDIDANNDGQVDGDEVGTAPYKPSILLQAAPALASDLGTGETAYVEISDRTKISRQAGAGTLDPSKRAGDPSAVRGLRVGTLTVKLGTGSFWKLDGTGKLASNTVDSSLSGRIKLSVSGRFQSDDKVVVGTGSNAFQLTPSGGMAEVNVPAEVGVQTIVYIPGGKDDLKPGHFAAGGAYEFNDRRNRSGPITWGSPPKSASVGQIKYWGVEVEGYAYGVVKDGGTDESFVRVTCEASSACSIFLDCMDQGGNEYFDAAPAVGAGETVVWDSEAIAGVLAGGWMSGRGRCDIHSTGHLSVQHLVRSGGHTLVNSSAVVGRSLDPREDRARASETAAVQAVVDSICRSVGDPTTDRDNTAAGTQVTACTPGEPWKTLP